MNIEIANKLLQLRKEKGLSQEQLAQELGISRQAVSKWERAEASPDTDNLIELAKLYDISLDELLLHQPTEKETVIEENDDEKYVHVGLNGIHVKEPHGDEVHVSWDKGIHVKENKGHQVDVDQNGVFVDGKEYTKNDFSYNKKYDFPFGLILFFITLIYCIITKQWHPTWIILLSLPLFDSFITAIRKRSFSSFAYPVLATMIYLGIGFVYGMWHPGWVIFLTIPCFYGIAGYLDHRKTSL